jgi:hypothetical protein
VRYGLNIPAAGPSGDARKRGDDWAHERGLIRAVAEAGATWRIEWVPADSPSTTRTAIERGPLRID